MAEHPSVRIFVSSPGDVVLERRTTQEVVTRLTAEFADRGAVSAYFWEYEPMLATKDFQDNIPSPAEFDIVVCVLWTRLGTRLDVKYHRPDGTLYDSGTEYELETAAESYRQRQSPDVVVYVNTTEPKVPIEPRDKREEFLRQYDALGEFLTRFSQTHKAYKKYPTLEEFEKVVAGDLHELIDAILPPAPPGPAPKPIRREGSPFRGLQAFAFQHADIFFGRRAAIADLLKALQNQVSAGRTFVMVLGVSGSGKSSLVRAGVVPLLIEPGAIEGIGLWRRAEMRPSDGKDDLFNGLAAALLRDEALPEIKADGTTDVQLAGLLRGNSDGVALLVRQALSQAAEQARMEEQSQARELLNQFEREGRVGDQEALARRIADLRAPQARLVLVVDQLEEMFTKAFTADNRRAFVRALDGFARGGRVFVIVTMRSDFYHRCADDGLEELTSLKQGDGQYDLGKPKPEEIAQMIRQPAAMAGLDFEQNPQTQQTLDELLRDDAAAHPESLPMLEFVLDELFKTRGGPNHRTLTFASYERLGKLEGAITTRAEETWKALPLEVRQCFPDVFRALLTVSEDGADTFVRRYANMDNLTADARRKQFVDAFIAARLFISGSADNRPTVAIAHEALINNWRLLREWREENRALLGARARVAIAASRWRESQFAADFLIPSGAQLRQAESLLTAGWIDIQEDERHLIEKSQKAERVQRQRDRLVRLVRYGALPLLAIIALGVWGTRQGQRQTTLLREAMKTTDASVCLADTVQAANLTFGRFPFIGADKTDKTLEDLLRTCLLRREHAALVGHHSGITSAAFSPRGDIVATASWDHSVRLWNVDTGAALRSLEKHKGAVNSVSFSPDGTLLVSASADRSARVWDVATGSEKCVLPDETGQVVDALFSPDGRFIVTAGGEGRLWQSDGSWSATPQSRSLGRSISHIAFSPSGDVFLTVGDDGAAKVWDSSGDRPRAEASMGPVNDAVFTPDGKGVITVGREGTRLWDWALQRPPMAGPSEGPVVSAAVTDTIDSGPVLATSSGNEAHVSQIGSSSSAKSSSVALRGHTAAVNRVDFSPGGVFVLTGSADGSARVWDRLTGNPVKQLRDDKEQSVDVVLFSPDGSLVLTAGQDSSAHLWRSGADTNPYRQHGSIRSVGFSQDGSCLVIAGADGVAYLRSTTSGQLFGQLKHGETTVQRAVFSPRGDSLLTAGEDGMVLIWTAAGEHGRAPCLDSQATRTTLSTDSVAATAVGFSPDAQIIAMATQDGHARLYARSGDAWQIRTELPAQPQGIYDIGFSRDGSTVITAGGDGKARIWNWNGASITEAGTIDADAKTLRRATFSPNGARVLTAGASGAALWRVDSRTLEFAFPGSAAVDAQFNHDGTLIAITQSDATVHIWDVRRGAALVTSIGIGEGPAFGVSFSPDDRRLVVATGNEARVYPSEAFVPIDQLRALAAGLASP